MLRRLWCEIRAYHLNTLWVSEWSYERQPKRRLQLRCDDCGHVKYEKVEYQPVAATSEQGEGQQDG